jgi:hypothetical protein
MDGMELCVCFTLNFTLYSPCILYNWLIHTNKGTKTNYVINSFIKRLPQYTFRQFYNAIIRGIVEVLHRPMFLKYIRTVKLCVYVCVSVFVPISPVQKTDPFLRTLWSILFHFITPQRHMFWVSTMIGYHGGFAKLWDRSDTSTMYVGSLILCAADLGQLYYVCKCNISRM